MRVPMKFLDMFQFQLGAIGRDAATIELPAFISFNSSLVRLGVECTDEFICDQIWFQFQLGAIGSCAWGCVVRFRIEFQFQLGAIGRFMLKYKYMFDSEFQFQLGAIGRRVEYNESTKN